MRIILRPYVELDLDEASNWYEEQRAGLKAEFLRAVEDVFSQIQDNPRLYPLVHLDIRRAPLRRFPYGVFYALVEGAIHILSVAADARHPAIWRGRR